MDRTFADRRKSIVEDGATAASILKQYPDLGSEEGVSNSFFYKISRISHE